MAQCGLRGDMGPVTLDQTVHRYTVVKPEMPADTPVLGREVVERYTRLYGNPLGAGRHRITFDRGDGHVLKVAWNMDGQLANAREAEVSRETNPYIPLPMTSVMIDTDTNVAVAEKVTPVQSDEGLPDWTMSVDMAQVGYTVDGRLVAYDL